MLFLARLCIPDSHGFVVATRGKVLPIGAVSYAPNKGGMSAESVNLLAAGGVPDPHTLVISVWSFAGRSEAFTIRTERYAVNPPLISGQGMEQRDLRSHALGI